MKTSLHFPCAKRKAGFSLVELLVVVGVISILMVLAGPSMSAAFKGSKLTQGAEAFRTLINQARQTALKNNLPVEIHMYKYDDVDTPETTEQYMAARLFILRLDNSSTENVMQGKVISEPVGNVVRLPAGIIISDIVKQSSLADPASLVTGTEAVKGLDPTVKETTANFVAFRIRPDGSLNLPAKKRWFLTFYNREEIIKGQESQPSDYVCLQVNPYTCDVRWYHPN